MAAGAVSVLGAYGQYQVLQYDANLRLAQKLARFINDRVEDQQLIPTDNGTPTLSGGASGEFVATRDGRYTLPSYYSAIVDNAAATTITGALANGADVMAGAGNLTLNVLRGSGEMVLGGGNDDINLSDQTGPWKLALGDGNDTVTLGSGEATIKLGTGNNEVHLGSGSAAIDAEGATTIFAGAHTGEVTVFGAGHVTFIGDASHVTREQDNANSPYWSAGAGNSSLGGGADQVVSNKDSEMFSYWNSEAGRSFTQNFVESNLFSSAPKGGPANSHLQPGIGQVVTLSDHTQITFEGWKPSHGG